MPAISLVSLEKPVEIITIISLPASSNRYTYTLTGD